MTDTRRPPTSAPTDGNVAGVEPDPASAATIKDWTVAYWEALHPYSAGGAYLNFLMDEGQERVRTSMTA